MDSLLPGGNLGRYRVVELIGRGGMAAVFKAYDPERGRHVAIKVVHEHLAADPTFVQMFVDEALLSSKIQHPNVVHVEQLRQVNGRHFLVMEYVHGCSLAMLLSALMGILFFLIVALLERILVPWHSSMSTDP